MNTTSKTISPTNANREVDLHPDEDGFYRGRVNKQPVEAPRVTTIIGAIFPTLTGADPVRVEEKRAIGEAVHEAIRLDVEEILDESTIDFNILPYFNAWRRFRESWVEKIVANEVLVYHDVWQYAGRFDLLCRMRGKIAMIDFKTRRIKKLTDALQLAAYNEGLKQLYGIKADLLFGLALGEDGDFRLTDVADPGALSTFLGALKSYRWRLKYGTT